MQIQCVFPIIHIDEEQIRLLQKKNIILKLQAIVRRYFTFPLTSIT